MTDELVSMLEYRVERAEATMDHLEAMVQQMSEMLNDLLPPEPPNLSLVDEPRTAI
jgi:hypothetical protein